MHREDSLCEVSPFSAFNPQQSVSPNFNPVFPSTPQLVYWRPSVRLYPSPSPLDLPILLLFTINHLFIYPHHSQLILWTR